MAIVSRAWRANFMKHLRWPHSRSRSRGLFPPIQGFLNLLLEFRKVGGFEQAGFNCRALMILPALCSPRFPQSLAPFNRRALPTIETELKLMAAAAKTGLS